METKTLLWIGGIALFALILWGWKKISPQKLINGGNKLNSGGKRPDLRPAKIAILENIERIKPLLNGLENGEWNQSEWSDLIVDIYNNELIEIWRKVKNRPDTWVRILASWGLSYDSCSEFIYIKGREELYEGAMKEGTVYKVISPAWILTDSQGHKTILLKGKVSLKS